MSIKINPTVVIKFKNGDDVEEVAFDVEVPLHLFKRFGTRILKTFAIRKLVSMIYDHETSVELLSLHNLEKFGGNK